MVLGLLGDHHAVHEHAGHLDLTRVEAARLGEALDLRDHHAARVVRGHGDGQHLERQRLALHGDVALRIGGGAADDADVDREGLVEKRLLAADRHHLHQLVGRALVELAAAKAGIDEGAEPDPGQMPGSLGSDVAEQVRDHALRQVVGLDAVGDGQLSCSFGTSPQ